MKIQSVLAAAFAIGLMVAAGAAQATEPTSVNALIAKTAHSQFRTEMQAQSESKSGVCDEKGEACYADSPHFCCSNLCVDGFCD